MQRSADFPALDIQLWRAMPRVFCRPSSPPLARPLFCCTRGNEHGPMCSHGAVHIEIEARVSTHGSMRRERRCREKAADSTKRGARRKAQTLRCVRLSTAWARTGWADAPSTHAPTLQPHCHSPCCRSNGCSSSSSSCLHCCSAARDGSMRGRGGLTAG
eukprot:75049-Chlamydomonas_euryale.AAC.1